MYRWQERDTCHRHFCFHSPRTKTLPYTLDYSCYQSAREYYKTCNGTFNDGVQEKSLNFWLGRLAWSVRIVEAQRAITFSQYKILGSTLPHKKSTRKFRFTNVFFHFLFRIVLFFGLGILNVTYIPLYICVICYVCCSILRGLSNKPNCLSCLRTWLFFAFIIFILNGTMYFI